MRNSMKLSVSFLAGTDIKEAIIQAKNLCLKLDLAFVSFNFNGVNVSVSNSADVEKLYKDFSLVFLSDDENKFIID